MTDAILALNAGSSSIKFAIFSDSDDNDLIYRGQVEGIGVSPRLTVRDADNKTQVERTWPAAGFDHGAATREILDTGVRLVSGMPVRGILVNTSER